MAIHAPGRRINPSIQRQTKGRKGVFAGLYLTSMVDMFAIMVIFLLNSFSAEGDLIVLPRGLELPEAENTGTLERAPSLVVSLDKIIFEGKELADTQAVFEQGSWPIKPLQDALKEYQLKLNEELAANPPKAPADADPETITKLKESEMKKINISADRRLPFQVVKKVIYNASFVGFPDFRFAVFGGGVRTPSKTD